MAERIDLAAVRQAREGLHRIARENPGMRWPDAGELPGILEGDDMGKTQQVAIRMDEGLLKRLDAHARALEAAQPGLKVSRADAIRVLLEQGLSATTTTTRKRGR